MQTQNTGAGTNMMLESDEKKQPTQESIQTWLVSYLADLLAIDQEEIDLTLPFERYGLDSSAAVVLTGDLESWLGCELDPTLLYDYPTIEALAQYLTQEANPKT